MRWVLLDEVISVEKGIAAKTRSHIPSAEACPETLMLEIMAQTGALLLGAESDFKEDLVFAKIEEARFRNHFRPGETIQVNARSENLRPEGAWIEGCVENERGTIAQSRFLLMNVKHILPNREKPVTFHDAFMNHFQIRDKVR